MPRPRQQFVAARTCLPVGIPARVSTGGCSDQQQYIADAFLLPQGADLLLQGQRRGIIQAARSTTEMTCSDINGHVLHAAKAVQHASARVGWRGW